MDVIDYNLIVSILTLISNIVLHFKFRHFHSLCCSSDCAKTPPPTPATYSKASTEDA